MQSLFWRGTLLLLFTCAVCSDADLPLPSEQAARDKWTDVLNTVWLTAKPRIAFCLGEKETSVVKTVLESFPDPLPTEPEADPVCSNATRLARHFCGPKSLMEYYKVSCNHCHLVIKQCSACQPANMLSLAAKCCLKTLLIRISAAKIIQVLTCCWCTAVSAAH